MIELNDIISKKLCCAHIVQIDLDEDADTPLSKHEQEATKAELTKLIMEGKVQKTTVLLHVKHNLLLGKEGEAMLVRPVDKLHVENIKTLMIKKPANFSAPFLLMMDPKDCPTKQDQNPNPDVYKTWKYQVLGGNHGARAKLSLFNMYGKAVFAQVEAWVFAGLSKREMRILSWSHNINQEYRKGMSNIDKIQACHTLFMENNMNRSKELKWKCCDELDLPYSKQKRDTLSTHDHMFQIAFRTGEVWDLQDKNFDMWLKFATIGQKKYISPVKPKNAKSTATQQSARALKKTSGDLNLGHWRALQGLPSQDAVKRLLLRVVNRMISLEQMFHEGDKIKKVVKVKITFRQLSGQPDWKTCREMFPDETEGSNLAAWIGKLGPKVIQFAFE